MTSDTDEEDLVNTIDSGETTDTEFKKSLSDSRKIIETIAAMATIGGGRILVGVSASGEAIGFELGAGEAERLVQRILAATDPKVYVDLQRLTIDDHALLEIRVPAGDGPHLAFGRAFYRSGPATVAMTRTEYERRLLDRLREAGGFERHTDASWTLDLIDEAAIHRFVKAGHRLGRSPAQNPDEQDKHRAAELLLHLHLVRGQALTAGGVLLFSANPQGPFPQATIRALARRGALEDSVSIEGTLFAQIEQATAFVQRNLKRKVRRAGPIREERDELPVAAVREVIANAIAHRDYRSTAPTQLRLTDTALTVWNPGHFPEPISAATLRVEHPSVPTNPFIARALYLAGYIEEWGTGTNRVIAAMAENQNPEPLFDDVTRPGGIQVVLPLPEAITPGLSARQSDYLADLKPGERFTTADYAMASGVSPRTALNDLKTLHSLGLLEINGQGKSRHWIRR